VVVSAPRMEDNGTSMIPLNTSITADLVNYSGDFINQQSEYQVIFGFDHYDQKYLDCSLGYSIIVNLEIKQYDELGSNPIVFVRAMTLEFDSFGVPMIDKVVYRDYGAGRVEVKLLSIDINGVSTNLLPFQFYVDCIIDVERYYDFGAVPSTMLSITSLTASDLNCDLQAIPDEVSIYWPGVIWAEEYQLEWTFVNDYAAPSGGVEVYQLPANLPFNFHSNSVRVSLIDPFYKISLVCEHGYLIFRVRAVGRDIFNPEIPVYGEWSSAESGLSIQYPNNYTYFNQNRHEGTLNWQYQVTYAEEGKHKEIANYFDGANKSRQTVTKINTDKRAIVAETIYDYNGRPAINIIPTPAKLDNCGSSAIGYFPDYNLDPFDHYNYQKDDFDIDAGDPCTSTTQPMGAANGSSNYYSPLNPEINYQQAFVPDALGFPFSQIEYTPDNTGRIKKQGGVGPDYQIGSNHETTYLYGQPYQIQLDRMFGSEAGDASHYKKNVVFDANGVSGSAGQLGQASVTYLDQSGRVIATALAGDAPPNLGALPAERNATQTLTVDLFSEDANGSSSSNGVSPDGMAMIFSTQLLVSYQSEYHFTYDISVPPAAVECTDICMTCVYDLEISILNDCGVNLATIGGNTIQRIVGQFTVNESNQMVFQTVCSSENYSELLTFDPITLTAGVYTINKVLRINQEALVFYVQQMTDPANNECVLTIEDFIHQSQLLTDTQCDVTCEECALALGARDEFISMQIGTELQYDLMMEACRAPCAPNTLCHSSYLMMLNDVMKGGQYGKFETQMGFSPQDFPLSVFNSTASNMLPTCHGTPNWMHPKRMINGFEYPMYIDVNNVRTKIPVVLNPGTGYSPEIINSWQVYTESNGQLYVYPENLMFIEDFLNNWHDGWEHSLVIYHPEYCYYEECSQYDQESVITDCYSSAGFDQLLRDINLMSQAEANNIIHFPNYSASSFGWSDFVEDIFLEQPGASVANACLDNSQPYDPFVVYGDQAGELFYPYGAQLKDKVKAFINPDNIVGNADDISLPTAISFLVRCQGVQNPNCGKFGYTDGSPYMNDQANEEWIMFKQLYMSIKQGLQFERADQFALSTQSNCGCYNSCIGNPEWDIFENNFFGSGNYTSSNFICSQQTSVLYAGMTPAFNFSTGDLETAAWEAIALQDTACNTPVLLQSLLNALSADDLLDGSNVNLSQYSAYNALLIEIYGDQPGDVPSGVQQTWSALSTDPDLKVFWSCFTPGLEQDENCFCSLHLTSPNSESSFEWDNIQAFYNLQPAGGSDFTVEIMYIGSDLQVHYAEIEGKTECVDLNCSPSALDDCEEHTTELGQDVFNLIAAIVQNGQIFSDTNGNGNLDSGETIDLNVAPYSGLVTNTIKYYLGTPANNIAYYGGGSWMWIVNLDNGYAITLLRDIQGLPDLPSWINDAESVEFNGCGTEELYGLDVDVINVTFHHGSDTFSTPYALIREFDFENPQSSARAALELCNCYDPSPCCQEGSNILLQDLEYFIRNMGVPEIVDMFNVIDSPYFTDLMQSNVSGSTSSVASTSTITTSNPLTTVQTITFPFQGCNLELSLTTNWPEDNLDIIHDQSANDPAYPFANCNLQVTGTPDVDGNYYDFFFTITNGQYTGTVYGHSCWPLRPCSPCGDIIPAPYFPSPVTDPCVEYMNSVVLENAEDEYNEYLADLMNDAAETYRQHCISSLEESFSTKYDDKEYHFTLYYYDQAGNLIRTVPPEGVQLLPVTSNTDEVEQKIIADRTFGTKTIFTFHNLATTYEYNSLNQLTKQFIPDHDPKNIWETKVPLGMDREFVMNAIQFVSPTTGYAAGYILMPENYDYIQRGVVYKTMDAGETWSETDQLVNINMTKVQMATTLVGFAVSDAGLVMKTFDGGETWDMLNLYNLFLAPTNYTGASYRGRINDLLFVDPSKGWLVGDNGTIITTTDGGRSFNLAVPSVPLSTNLNITSISSWQGKLMITVVSNNTNPALGEIPYSEVFYSQQNNLLPGNPLTWSVDGMTPGRLTVIQPLTNASVFIAGEDGNLFYNNNMSVLQTGTSLSGSWQIPDQRIREQHTNHVGEFKGVFFKDAKEGIGLMEQVPGSNITSLYKTFDYGKTWQQMSATIEDYNDCYTYFNEPGTYGSKVIAVGENNLLKRVIMTNGTPYGQVTIGAPALNGKNLKQVWAYPYSTTPYRLLMVVATNAGLYLGTTNGVDAQVANWTAVNFVSPILSSANTGVKEMIVKPFLTGTVLSLSVSMLCENGKLYSFVIKGDILNSEYAYNSVQWPTTNIQNGSTELLFDDICEDPLVNRIWGVFRTGSGARVGILDMLSAGPSTWALNFKEEALASVLSATQQTYASTILVRDIACKGNTIYLAGDDGNYQMGTYTFASGQLFPTIVWKSRSSSFAFCPINDLDVAGTNAVLCGNGSVYSNRANTIFDVTSNTNTWKLKAMGGKKDLRSIDFRDNITGVMAGNQGAMYQFNLSGGLNPTMVNTGTLQNLLDIKFSPSALLYACGENGTLLYSPDYTSQPFELLVTSTPATLRSICFKPGNNDPIVVGDQSSIFSAMQNATSRIDDLFVPGLSELSFHDGFNGYAGGNGMPRGGAAKIQIRQNYYTTTKNTLRYTSDGGSTWSTVLDPALIGNCISPAMITALATTSTGRAIAAFDKKNFTTSGVFQSQNTILSRIQQSNTPVVLTAKASAIVNDIQCPAANAFYAVGATATYTAGGTSIVTIANKKTTAWSSADNGISWPQIGTSFVSGELTALHAFKRNNTFIAVGLGGVRTAFYDGSQMTWNGAYANGLPDIKANDVFFYDDLTGYIVGYECFYKTGESTTLINDIESNYLDAIDQITWSSTVSNYFPDQFNGQNVLAKITFNAIGFTTRYDGVFGGSYDIGNPDFPNNGYHRKVWTESGLFSMHFWYDRLGRLILSQNTKQYNKGIFVPNNPSYGRLYTYTLYDELGRISEVGQKEENTGGTFFNGIFGMWNDDGFSPTTVDDYDFTSWINGDGRRTEVTRTYYDQPADFASGLDQRNLRNRVASVAYYDHFDGLDIFTYNHATHYSYDIHGNVNSLVQENARLPEFAQIERYKIMTYDYDLISGKVNAMNYQEGAVDQLLHRYEYDADNRLRMVETSTDGVIWDNDAKYMYYAHGPLARTELGDNKVQGVDYAYTLQGWLKGMNSARLTLKNDMGYDGLEGTPNSHFARDAAGFTLGYYYGDYMPIDQGRWDQPNRFEAEIYATSVMAARKDLFNGNIGHMVTTILKPDIQNPEVNRMTQAAAYEYDQLNRLTTMTGHDNYVESENTFKETNGRPDLYKNLFQYDANGNIVHQVRMDQSEQLMDDLSYNYKDNLQGERIQNRLYHVNDGQSDINLYANDIDDQGVFDGSIATINVENNYGYDEIGNLLRDDQEGITEIVWTISGKVKEIHKTPESMNPFLIKFDYDALGNRIAKHLHNAGTEELISSTYYLRDAQGNTMAVYTYDSKGYRLKERHIYGSSRLGMITSIVNMMGRPNHDWHESIHEPGYKQFEISNHLGNVLTVVADRKVPIGVVGGDIAYYNPEVLSSTDYYPFGAPMAGRNFGDGYRYGFNGQEKDDEVAGSDNSYTAEFWQYDGRLGRRWNIDPVVKPNMSPYSCFDDNPIYFSDPNGLTGRDPYKVKKGDNLSSIAKNNNTSVEEIMKLNPSVKDQNKIYAGQSLNLPGASESSPKTLVVNPVSPTKIISKTVTVSNSSNATGPLLATAGIIIADDVTGIGVADDPLLIPIAIGLVGTLIYDAVKSRDVDITVPIAVPIDQVDVNVKKITLYRGVPRGHPDYLNALKGVATPLGGSTGHSDPNKHNEGNTLSVFTSWSLSRQIANQYATVNSAGGVVLVKQFYIYETVPSPDHYEEFEILVPGVVTGARVTLPGPAKK
jgi:photosystem II stability/assembly factor-like uncharacterized protein